MTGNEISLRDCKIEDAKTLYKWRNMPEIIALSSLKKSVRWDEHVDWLKSCLGAPNDHGIFVVVFRGIDAGVVRFDRIEISRAAISLHLEPSYWGSGLGGEILKASLKRASVNWYELKSVEAVVINSNKRAIRMFERAGFCQVKEVANAITVKFEYLMEHQR